MPLCVRRHVADILSYVQLNNNEILTTQCINFREHATVCSTSLGRRFGPDVIVP